MKKKTLCAAVLTCLAATGVALGAGDFTYLTFHGTSCVETSDTTPEIRYQSSFATNDSTSADNTWQCPITRGHQDGNGALREPWIYVFDQRSNADASCFVVSCDYLTSGCSLGPTASSSGTGVKSLSLGDIVGYGYGKAYIQCFIPRRVSTQNMGIVGYHAFSSPTPL